MQPHAVSERKETAKIATGYDLDQKRLEPRRDWLSVACLLALIGLIFWPTVFATAPLSKLPRLTLWDSAFASWRQGSGGLMDPSLLQLMIPYYLLVGKLWHAHHLPLWNQFSACGVPLLADPQAQVFSPLHAVLAFFPDLRAYNLIILAQLCIGAVGTFLLARELQLARLPALSAAISFAFCPFLDWFLELIGAGYMLYPLVFWSFTRLVKKPNLTRSSVCGGIVATMVLSGHPEVSLFGAGFGAVYAVILSLSLSAGRAQSTGQRLAGAIAPIALVAVIAFALSAPLLLPFIEYIRIADCYKLAGRSVDHIPWQALLINLFQPALGGASLYLGVLPLLSLPFCFALSNRQGRRYLTAVLLTLLLAEAFTSSIFPLKAIASALAPTLIANYCQPVSLLMIALAAAFGFQGLLSQDCSVKGKLGKVFLATGIIAALAPLLVRVCRIPLAGLSFDSSLPLMKLGAHEWSSLALLTAAVTALVLLRARLRPSLRATGAAACLLLSFASQLPLTKQALSPQAQFNYPLVDCITALAQTSNRYIAVGDHLLKPNTNVVYGLRDLRFHNPVFPPRYRSFLSACLAHMDGFNETFDGSLNKVLGLASVDRVLSQGPVWSKSSLDDMRLSPLPSAIEWPGLKLTALSAAYDASNQQVVGKLRWSLETKQAGRYSYSIVVLNQNDEILWFSDQRRFDEAAATNPIKEEIDQFGAQIAPSTGEENKRPSSIWVGVRIFDHQKTGFVPPVATPVKAANCICRLFDLGAWLPRITDPSFHLKTRLSNGLCLYENSSAVPQAYLVGSVKAVATPQESLQVIQSGSFDCNHEAVIESTDSLALSSKEPGRQSVRLYRPSAERVIIHSACEQATLLVLTDTFFPGWSARVDDNPVQIYRTNYLFRGVFLPAGAHKIVFSYRPLSVFAGIALAALCLLCLGGIGIFRIMASRRSAAIVKDRSSS